MHPANCNPRRDVPTARATRPCSTAFWTLPWHAGGRLLGRVLKQIVSYHNHIAVKWRRWFDRKAWAQNGQRLRCKRNGNDYERCCIFHVLRFYPTQPDSTSLIVMDFRTPCGSRLGKHHMMVEASRKRTRGLIVESALEVEFSGFEFRISH